MFMPSWRSTAVRVHEIVLLVRLQQLPKLPLGGVVCSGARVGRRLDPDVLVRLIGLDLDHGGLPADAVRLRHDPETATPQIDLPGHVLFAAGILQKCPLPDETCAAL